MKGFMQNVTSTLELYFSKKAPALPVNIKELLVKFAPWINIFVIVMTLPVVLGFLGLGSLFYTPMMGGYLLARVGFNYTLAMIFLVITLVLRGIAIPGLLSRSIKGWNMLYYSTLVNALYSLLNFEIVSMLIGTAISLYFIFQVKDYYK
ncbi:chromate transporter [candidate division WWE3 bacterium]|uniref:Chromate transporter n=1 Tax=candidate division WWE3 bacterium TaxID=2053526 RepID=A0A7X9DKE8_UNCKA|nr:chromate transporter [candidate division WWE3 bacterium]